MKPALYRLLNAVTLALLTASCGDNSQTANHITQPVAQATRVSQGAPASAAIADAQFEVTALQKNSETRISRTVYEYTYQVSIRNNGSSSAADVRAMLSAAPSNTTIVDGKVNAGSIAAGTTVTPADPIVLRIDRTKPFNTADLTWTISASSVRQLAPVEPAEVVELPLAALGLPSSADKVSVSGAITDVLLKDGTLRFSTPSDQGVPQRAEFTLQSGTTSTVLSQPILTERPAAPLLHVEPLDDGSTPDFSPLLTIAGFGPNNSFSNNPLIFRLNNLQSLDLMSDSDGLVTGTDNTSVRLKDYWSFNPADNSFTISSNQMQKLLSALPKGALTLMLNFVSRDGAFASSYQLLATHPIAMIAGRLITPEGTPVTSLAGKKMLLRGYNQRLRLVAPVDSNGNFNFADVIPDTYQLTLNDLEKPNVVSASTIVLQDTTTASVTITYPSDHTLKGLLAAPNDSYVASTVKQNGTPLKGRSLAPHQSPPSLAPSAASANDSAIFLATAAAQNATITTPVSYQVAKGVKNVGIRITISTAEYPIYTRQQSQYNDTWSYALTGLPGVAIAASDLAPV